MKGGKDEGKALEPLFPRLHVNDWEKGGPRAPPRNKMALYEQFSIPSKRFYSSPSSSSSLTVPSQKVATLAPCSSAVQTNGHEKMVLSASNVPLIPHSNSEESVRHHSSDKTDLNTIRMEFGTSFKRHASNNTSIARGPAPEYGSHHLPDSNTKKTRENDEDDDFCVPTFVPPEVVAFSNCDFPASRPEKLSTFHVEVSRKSSSIPFSNLRDKCLEGTDANRNSRNYEKGHSEHEDVVEEEGDSKYITGSCSKSRPGNVADIFDQETHDQSNDPLELGDEDRGEVSEASMVGSLACMMISPDDVVGVIGTKHFWKARRAIVDQQRVFAVQVFELHRLIKVQKLIATSSDALKIDLHLRPSSPKVISENPPRERIEKFPSPPDNIVEANSISERDPPQCEIPRSVPHSTEIRPNTFCFQAPTNQWLVPVVSPSEGLIYKPYSGPCPPIGGFVSPFYGGYPPFGFQLPTYFQSPYGLPMVNPMVNQNIEHDLQQSWSAHVVSNPRKETISGRVRKFQASRDSEVQGSAVSNPCEQARDGGKEGWTLFRTPQASGTRNQMPESCRQNHAIRVVPHKARSAAESAARIFRSIQRERQQYKS